MGLTQHDELRQQWILELDSLQELLYSRGFKAEGRRVDAALHPTLAEITTLWYEQWLRDFPHGPTAAWLQGAWLTALADSGNEDAAFFSFGRWEEALVALYTSWDDGEASHFVEDAYATLCADVDLLQWAARSQQLRLSLIHI